MPGGDELIVSRTRLPLITFAALTALIGIFLLRDASAFVNSAQDELIGHLGASAGLTIAATGTLLVLRRQRPPLVIVLLAGAAATMVLELAQGFVPDRGIELRDIATGFGGVLVAALCIEVVLHRFRRSSALRIHVSVAALASMVLLVLLLFDLAPETLADGAPDGDSCALTTIDGAAQRIVLGPAAQSIEDNCLQTSVGGLGLFGPGDADSLAAETVLLSSPLGDLVPAILGAQRLIVTTEIVTGDFSDESRPPGVVLILRSNEAGELLQVRTRDQTTQILGPSFLDAYRSVAYTQALEPNTRYELQVELTASTLATYLDGELVATNAVDPGWLDAMRESDAADDMTLYIGNGPSRTLPFRGVIEWVEIGT